MEDEPPVKRKPVLGVAQGQVVIPDSFFEPLPDEMLKTFYEGEIFPPPVKDPENAEGPVNGSEPS